MKIPNNLVAGDRLWYSETEYATVGLGHHMYDIIYDKGVWLWATGRDGNGLAYDVARGTEVYGATKPIIRIERIASAPAKPKRAKVDKDAAWLSRLANAMNVQGAKSECRRLRAIARRLEGSKP